MPAKKDLEAKFLLAIHSQAGEPTPKLIYADWLEEQGDDRSELVRWRERVRAEPELEDQFLACVRKVFGVQGANVLQGLMNQASPEVQLAFVADCAERVLPLYEMHHPGDRRPRDAVQAIRDYLRGEIDETALRAARAQARRAANTARSDATGIAAEAAAEEKAYTAISRSARIARKPEDKQWRMLRLVDLLLYGWDYPE